MMTIKDNTLVAFDGKRRIAVARKKQHGWLVVADVACWLEAKDKKNVFGIMNHSMILVKNKSEAKKLINSVKSSK